MQVLHKAHAYATDDNSTLSIVMWTKLDNYEKFPSKEFGNTPKDYILHVKH